MLGGRASTRAGPIVDVYTVCVCVPLALYDRRKPVVMVTPQRGMPYSVTLLARVCFVLVLLLTCNVAPQSSKLDYTFCVDIGLYVSEALDGRIA